MVNAIGSAVLIFAVWTFNIVMAGQLYGTHSPTPSPYIQYSVQRAAGCRGDLLTGPVGAEFPTLREIYLRTCNPPLRLFRWQNRGEIMRFTGGVPAEKGYIVKGHHKQIIRR